MSSPTPSTPPYSCVRRLASPLHLQGTGLRLLILIVAVFGGLLARGESHGQPGGYGPVCPQATVPRVSVADLQRWAQAAASASHLHYGSGKMIGNVYAFVASQGQAEEGLKTLLDVYEANGGAKGVGDRGQALALAGEIAARLPANHPLVQRTLRTLSGAMTATRHHAGLAKALLEDGEHVAVPMIESAAAGYLAMAKAGLLDAAQRRFLATVPIPPAAQALAISLANAEPDERRQLVAAATKELSNKAFDRVRNTALTKLAPYLDPESVKGLEGALKDSVSWNGTFDPTLVGALESAKRFAVDPRTREAAERILVAHLPKGVVGAVKSFDSARKLLERDEERTRQEFLKEAGKLTRELAGLGLDIAGIISPGPICDGLSGCLALADGDYLGAALSAIAILPYVGDGIVKPLRLGRRAQRFVQLAHKLEGLLSKMARYRNRIEEVLLVARLGGAVLRGEQPLNDRLVGELLDYAEARHKLPRAAGVFLRNFAAPVAEDLKYGTADATIDRLANGGCNVGARGMLARWANHLREAFGFFSRTPRPVVRGQMPEESADPLDPWLDRMGLRGPERDRARELVRQRQPADREAFLATLLEAKFPAD